jgi:hypothetical protein
VATDDDDEECDTDDDDDDDEEHHSLRIHDSTKALVPAFFFHPSLSLDRTLGPNHAYLVDSSSSLPHGSDLFQNTGRLWKEFLEACRSRTFSQLCVRWKNDEQSLKSNINIIDDDSHHHHSPEQIQRFQDQFAPGLIPAAKHGIRSGGGGGEDYTISSKNNLIPLLLRHGANAFETDSQGGASPLHWAAGHGNLPGVHALLQSMRLVRQTGSGIPAAAAAAAEQGNWMISSSSSFPEENPMIVDLLDDMREYRRGATPFHWACGSVRPDFGESGTGNT